MRSTRLHRLVFAGVFPFAKEGGVRCTPAIRTDSVVDSSTIVGAGNGGRDEMVALGGDFDWYVATQPWEEVRTSKPKMGMLI